jgi:hypothetical protein
MDIANDKIRFPENLKVKAELTIRRITISEMATLIKQGRNWVTQVLNGHQEGKETIEKIRQELAKQSGH